MKTLLISLAVSLVVLPATAFVGYALVTHATQAIHQLLKGTK